MLAKVLEDCASYGEAGAPYGLGRSSVEGTIKALVLQVARERGIPALDEDALDHWLFENDGDDLQFTAPVRSA